MKRRRDRVTYRDKVPSPLSRPEAAEKLALVEGMDALGRELTTAERTCCIAVAHLFCGAIIDRDTQIAALESRLLDLHRRLA